MNTCKRPPEGWACTREAGHDGPCAAIFKTERPRTEFEEAMFNAEKQRLMDAAQNLKGRSIQEVAWSLKCIIDDVRSVSNTLCSEQRANATLALRHLEDAHHRMTLAQASESTTVSSDKQKIENLARQCVRNAETIKDLRAKLE